MAQSAPREVTVGAAAAILTGITRLFREQFPRPVPITDPITRRMVRSAIEAGVGQYTRPIESGESGYLDAVEVSLMASWWATAYLFGAVRQGVSREAPLLAFLDRIGDVRAALRVPDTGMGLRVVNGRVEVLPMASADSGEVVDLGSIRHGVEWAIDCLETIAANGIPALGVEAQGREAVFPESPIDVSLIGGPRAIRRAVRVTA